MKLKQLIIELLVLERRHGGDDEVIVTGLYSSEAAIEGVSRVKTERESHVEIITDLCTG